jgi:hypothetical protein
MKNEGYEEIEIINPLNSGIMKVIKSCNNCQYKKSVLVKSGNNPLHVEVCILSEEKDRQGFKLNTKLYRNFYGYYEPPGFDGEECPFHKQLLREKSINKLLEE